MQLSEVKISNKAELLKFIDEEQKKGHTILVPENPTKPQLEAVVHAYIVGQSKTSEGTAPTPPPATGDETPPAPAGGIPPADVAATAAAQNAEDLPPGDHDEEIEKMSNKDFIATLKKYGYESKEEAVALFIQIRDERKASQKARVEHDKKLLEIESRELKLASREEALIVAGQKVLADKKRASEILEEAQKIKDRYK